MKQCRKEKEIKGKVADTLFNEATEKLQLSLSTGDLQGAEVAKELLE